MGIVCEINLLKPADGYFRSGTLVSGTLKYTLNEDTIFNQITISLKGNGCLTMKRRNRHGHKRHRYHNTLRNNETYVDTDIIIHKNEKKKTPLSKGTYETQFSFPLPPNVPSSLKCFKRTIRFIIRCQILYYIRVKFEKPGFTQFDLKFKNNIIVVSGITPRLSNVPIIFGKQKKVIVLSQLFSGKKSIVDIKANIQSCILQPGGKIDINYVISNNTKVVIEGVKSKLIETYKFTSNGGRNEDIEEDVPFADSKSGSIKCAHSQNMDVSITVPYDRHSLEHSKMVSREYAVVIKAILPLPYEDAVLKIPLQIDVAGMIVVCNDAAVDSPPSYWEVMGEETKGKSGGDNDDDEDDGDDSGDDKNR